MQGRGFGEGQPSLGASPRGSEVENPLVNSGDTGVMGSIPEKIPWRRTWQPTPGFLPGESPWTEEPGRLQSMGLQRVGQD